MSKAVRLKDYLYDEVERLAKEERRSLANMVEVLLEQALALQDKPMTVESVQAGGLARVQVSRTPRADRSLDDPHFKPDFK